MAVNRPETRVYLNRVRMGFAPFERNLAAGVYTLRLESPGHKPWQGRVELIEGALTPVRAMLRPAPSRTSGGVVAALSGVMFATGLVLGVLSDLDRSGIEADRSAGRLDNLDPRIDRGAMLAGFADASLALGVALGALGIFLLAYDPTPDSIARVGRARALGRAP